MIAIRAEIAAIEQGEANAADNLLKNAPHTADLLLAEWTRPYPREQAFFPVPAVRENKYWPPVGRIDNVYGDRNLICSCPRVGAYQAAAE
jgi:glycine dehydrogenase